MYIFLISTLIGLIMLAEKYFFFLNEPNYKASLTGRLNLALLTALFITGVLVYLFKEKGRLKPPIRVKSEKMSRKHALGIILTIWVLAFTLFLNSTKQALDWDAVALYDARARFLKAEINFSRMSQFSSYDEISYYYLLYPPYTSIAHYFWELSGINLPVSVYYSLTLMAFAALFFLFVKRNLGLGYAILATLLVIANKDIFSISIIEYTNLPYVLHVFLGIMFLFEYIKERSMWKFLFAAFFISSSIWIRFLEPVWILIIVGYVLTRVSQKYPLNRLILESFALFGLSLLETYSWSMFTRQIAGNPSAIDISSNKISGMIIGLVDGRMIMVLSYLLKWWGITLIAYLLVIMAAKFSKLFRHQNYEIKYLANIFVMSIPFYFAAIYFSSFQGEWWKNLAGSLIRSSSFLVPISIILLIYIYSKNTINNTHLKGGK